MATNNYGALAINGGGTGAMDLLAEATLNDGDMCMVVVPSTGKTYVYTWDDDNSGTESPPELISPDDTSGNGRWVLTYFYLQGVGIIERATNPTEPDEGHAVIWMTDGQGTPKASGADGDILIASKAGGTTKTGILFDHSGGSPW